MAISLERGADLHITQLMPLPLTDSCFSKIRIGFTFLVLADPGSPWQRAIKWLYVYVCQLLVHDIKRQMVQEGCTVAACTRWSLSRFARWCQCAHPSSSGSLVPRESAPSHSRSAVFAQLTSICKIATELVTHVALRRGPSASLHRSPKIKRAHFLPLSLLFFKF